jgi:MFS family permease
MSQTLTLGVRVNAGQIALQVTQIFLVGLTIGMTRVVIPGLAETEFGLAANSFFLLSSFVVVFGAVKAVMNLFAGGLSERYGRKTILIAGWLVALPIPFLFLWAPNWNWMIGATVLLGFNQGMAWSMALNSKLDLAQTSQKGLINGINEFSGYAAVGIAGAASAILVDLIGAREGLFYFSLVVVLLGLFLAVFFVKETLPWAALHHVPVSTSTLGEDMSAIEHKRSLKQLFIEASLKNKPLIAINQAGLIEKFTDALVWIFLPIFFVNSGLSLISAGGIIAIYGVTWGVLQLLTGPLSDKVGRKSLIGWGLVLCGVGALAIPFSVGITLWSFEAFIIGLGMAMLYPNLGAAVGDFAPAHSRAALVGIYRFWRDSGYAFGALLMGLLAQVSQSMVLPFMFVGISMLLSAVWFYMWLPQNEPHG